MAKIGIVHYRAGRTDGVSLEISKRKQVLQELGHDVCIVSGPVSEGADYVIPKLEFDTPDIREIKELSFSWFGREEVDCDRLIRSINVVSEEIEALFRDIHDRESFDALLVHNIFSHGRHIAAASAFARIAESTRIPVVATHHDYYFDRPEYQETSCPAVAQYLDLYVPPRVPSVTHISINSLAQRELLRRSGIESTVLGDFFDFGQEPWVVDSFNHDFLDSIDVRSNDLVVLQATRIVERKGIENAIRFVKQLDGSLNELVGHTLYNGKKVVSNTRVVLVLAGYAEDSSREYENTLRKEVQRLGIEARFAASLIGAERESDSTKRYSLWDAYAHADLVTYPSLSEGWGNQFIEAVFAKKPIVVFEYPVFRADIKPEGYDFVSLGSALIQSSQADLVSIPDRVLRRAVQTAIEALKSRGTAASLDRNFDIGRANHGLHVLRAYLEQVLA